MGTLDRDYRVWWALLPNDDWWHLVVPPGVLYRTIATVYRFLFLVDWALKTNNRSILFLVYFKCMLFIFVFPQSTEL